MGGKESRVKGRKSERKGIHMATGRVLRRWKQISASPVQSRVNLLFSKAPALNRALLQACK